MACLSPCQVSDDSADLLLANSELSSEFSLENSAFRIASPDSCDVIFSELGPSVLATSVVGQYPAPTTLGHHVDGIVLMSSQEPMLGVLARWVVAGVTDIQVGLDGTYVVLVSPAGGDDSSFTIPEDSIVLARFLRSDTSPPWPAVIGTSYLDFGPVSGEALRRSVRSTHRPVPYSEDEPSDVGWLD